MKLNSRKGFFAIVLVGFLILLIREFLSLPSAEKIPGAFNQTAFIRNENNMGSIISLYAFSTGDTTKADYIALGNLMPHNKSGGITTVYFFDNNQSPAAISLDPPHFDTTVYKPLAIYRRDRHLPPALTHY